MCLFYVKIEKIGGVHVKLKKAMIAAALAASVLFTSTSASYTALAAPRETAQELANYKLAITTRINEIEQALW